MVQEKLVSSEKTKNDNNVYHDEPELRFEKFDESWKEYCLEDCVIFLDNERKPLKESDRADKKGKYPYYGASGIIDYIDDYIFDDELILMGEDGANIITRSSRLVFLAKGKFWVNNHAHVFKAKQNFDSYFLAESLERINYEKYNTGTAQPKLNQEVCAKIKFKLPNIDEQKRISIFLQHIDKKIELLEKKLVLCRELELTIKNKIFNNETKNSFIKLNEICSIKKGKQLNKSDMIENGKYYVLNGGKEPSGYTNSWNVKENTITISEGGNSCGYVSFNSEKFYCGGHCYYLTLKTTDFDLNYLFHYLKYMEPKIMRLRVGSGLPNIQKGDIGNINILKKEFNKQKEIGDFLESINIKISLILKEKEELELFKKGLLQKMFI